MEPELLRLREGVQLNKSLLAFASTLHTLSREGTSLHADYDQSVLTQLLSGGCCE